MPTQVEIDWISDLYLRICKITTRYVFTSPVEQTDLDAFTDALAVVLPSGCTPTAELRKPGYVTVEVRRGARLYYGRDMIIDGV